MKNDAALVRVYARGTVLVLALIHHPVLVHGDEQVVTLGERIRCVMKRFLLGEEDDVVHQRVQ